MSDDPLILNINEGSNQDNRFQGTAIDGNMPIAAQSLPLRASSVNDEDEDEYKYSGSVTFPSWLNVWKNGTVLSIAFFALLGISLLSMAILLDLVKSGTAVTVSYFWLAKTPFLLATGTIAFVWIYHFSSLMCSSVSAIETTKDDERARITWWIWMIQQKRANTDAYQRQFVAPSCLNILWGVGILQSLSLGLWIPVLLLTNPFKEVNGTVVGVLPGSYNLPPIIWLLVFSFYLYLLHWSIFIRVTFNKEQHRTNPYPTHSVFQLITFLLYPVGVVWMGLLIPFFQQPSVWRGQIVIFSALILLVLYVYVSTLRHWQKRQRPRRFQNSLILTSYVIVLIWILINVNIPALSGLKIWSPPATTFNGGGGAADKQQWPYPAILNDTSTQNVYSMDYVSIMPTEYNPSIEWGNALPLGPIQFPLYLDGLVIPFTAYKSANQSQFLCTSQDAQKLPAVINTNGTNKIGLIVQRGICGFQDKAMLAQGKGYSALFIQNDVPPSPEWWRPYSQTGFVQVFWIYPQITIPIAVLSPESVVGLRSSKSTSWEAYHMNAPDPSVTDDTGVSSPISYTLMVAPLLLALITFQTQQVSWISSS